MSETLLASLTGRRFPRSAAKLEGFERIVPAEGYPYIVPCAGAEVDGVLITDVDAASLAALDDYEDEGRLYTRRPVEVLAGGHPVTCETYVGNADALRPPPR